MIGANRPLNGRRLAFDARDRLRFAQPTMLHHSLDLFFFGRFDRHNGVKGKVAVGLRQQWDVVNDDRIRAMLGSEALELLIRQSAYNRMNDLLELLALGWVREHDLA